MRKTNVALITGASSGIGRCLCYRFAEGGTKDLIVTARREQQLTQLKEDIESRFSCRVHILPFDLADPETPDALYDEVKSLGLVLDVLVNNAGYAVEGRFIDTSWKDQEDLVRVLCTAPTKLTHLFLPDMVKRGEGGLINIASTGAYCPGTPYMALYGGLKHYQLAMTRALSEELKSTGVTITVACPGATDTEWVDNSGSRGLFNRMPSWLIASPDNVATQAYEAYMSGKEHVITGFGAKLLTFFTKHMPVSLTLSQLAKSYK